MQICNQIFINWKLRSTLIFMTVVGYVLHVSIGSYVFLLCEIAVQFKTHGRQHRAYCMKMTVVLHCLLDHIICRTSCSRLGCMGKTLMTVFFQSPKGWDAVCTIGVLISWSAVPNGHSTESCTTVQIRALGVLSKRPIREDLLHCFVTVLSFIVRVFFRA